MSNSTTAINRLLPTLSSSSEARKAAAEANIIFFAKYYLGNHIKGDVPNFHKDWLDLATTEPRIALAAPRGHAKSTIFSLVYPLWCILHKKKAFIVIISDTINQASELLGTIVQELENNPRIVADYGNIAGYSPQIQKDKTKWTARDVVTTTGVKIVAAGWKSKLRGLKFGDKRPDLVIVDDLENDESVNSPMQRAKVAAVFYRSILNLGDQTTQIIVVGTILHTLALLASIIKSPPLGWVTKLYKAIVDNQPLWTTMWTIERLEQKKREIGSLSFEQEFMNNPVDKETQLIKPVAFYENLPDTQLTYYGYLDLAISESESADYVALVPVGIDPATKKMYIVGPQRMKGNVQQQLEFVFTMHERYRFQTLGIESVAYQKAFYQILKDESARRNIYIPAVEVGVDKDKVRRAMGVLPHIENGTVLFHNSHQDLLSEVSLFPTGDHDDLVDSLVGGIKIAIQYNSTSASDIISARGLQYPKNY